MIHFIAYPLLILMINYFIKNKNFIKSNTGSNHQVYVNKSIPLTGGIFLLIPLLNLYYSDYLFFSYILILIFILGLLSDLNIFSSPKKRFIIQTLVILLFVMNLKLEVLPTRVRVIDEILSDTYLSYIFTVFCLMVLLNGSNFIDGLNGLLLGYLLIIFFILIKLDLLETISLSENKIIFFIFIFLFIFLLNFLNQLFLGDSGAYSLGFVIGYTLIEIYNQNQHISPYFIILLLWYPCFENLFSIIRKFNLGRSPVAPDSKHFHQLLFYYLKNKYKFNNFICNNFSSITINTYNCLILYFGSLDIYNTQYLVTLIFTNIIIYTIIYLKLFKFKYRNL